MAFATFGAKSHEFIATVVAVLVVDMEPSGLTNRRIARICASWNRAISITAAL